MTGAMTAVTLSAGVLPQQVFEGYAREAKEVLQTGVGPDYLPRSVGEWVARLGATVRATPAKHLGGTLFATSGVVGAGSVAAVRSNLLRLQLAGASAAFDHQLVVVERALDAAERDPTKLKPLRSEHDTLKELAAVLASGRRLLHDMDLAAAAETDKTATDLLAQLSAPSRVACQAIIQSFAAAIKGQEDATAVWWEAHNGRLVLAHEAARPVMRDFEGILVRHYDAKAPVRSAGQIDLW